MNATQRTVVVLAAIGAITTTAIIAESMQRVLAVLAVVFLLGALAITAKTDGGSK